MDKLVADAVALLLDTEPPEGYSGAFSGGKDSVVIKRLAELAGIEVRWRYNVTTIDPPELVAFIRRKHPDVTFLHPEKPFFQRMTRKTFPTMGMRWCCSEYKELPISGVCVMGIRWAEGKNRLKTWKYPITARYGGFVLNPILKWTDEQVWQFIKREEVPYCELYDEGFFRLGCVGCPLAKGVAQRRELKRWPNFDRAWRQAFRDLWDWKRDKQEPGDRPWCELFENADALFEWWIGNEKWPGKNRDYDNDGEVEGCQGLLF